MAQTQFSTITPMSIADRLTATPIRLDVPRIPPSMFGGCRGGGKTAIANAMMDEARAKGWRVYDARNSGARRAG